MLIDLKSDTVTRPVPPMLEAMMKAPVGDDVFGEDPSINALEAKAAALFGKEKAMFCPSGTMANQIAVRLATKPGNEVICHQSAHVYKFEAGGMAANSGVSIRLTRGPRGIITPEEVFENFNPADHHYPQTRLVVIENTCNSAGGTCYTLEELQAVSTLCREMGLAIHLDGARIFNAIVRMGYTTGEIGPLFDTISFCLSKGLGCPVGSMLVGSDSAIEEARRLRKILGGGMRQGGFLAAAGLYALEHHIDRLADDHRHAKELAAILRNCSWAANVPEPETNILIFDVASGFEVWEVLVRLKSFNIEALPFGKQSIRFVTHHDFTPKMLAICSDALPGLFRD